MTAKRKGADRTSTDLIKQQFERVAGSGAWWLVRARDLHRATELLWKQLEVDHKDISNLPVGAGVPFSLIAPTLLLAALTIENLVKGIIVCREGAFDDTGKFKHKSHKLLDLLERIEVALSDEETDLVERLAVFLKWAGRYPVPLTHDDLLPREDASGRVGQLTTMKSPEDRRVWPQLVRKLDGMLESEATK